MFVRNKVFLVFSCFLKQCKILFFVSRTSNFIDDEEFLCCLTFSSGKTPAFRTKIIQLSTWMRWPSPSVCQSLDLEKETLWCDSCFPYKVYFLYIKDIWFALPKYVQLNSITYEFARSVSTAVVILRSKNQFISRIFNQHRLLGEKRNDTWIYEDKKMQRTSKIA